MENTLEFYIKLWYLPAVKYLPVFNARRAEFFGSRDLRSIIANWKGAIGDNKKVDKLRPPMV